MSHSQKCIVINGFIGVRQGYILSSYMVDWYSTFDLLSARYASYYTATGGLGGGGVHETISMHHIHWSFQPVLHNWCNKGCGMCYPVFGMMHIKEPLLLIGKSSLCGSSGFPLTIWRPFTWRHITVNKNVLNVSLNNTFPSFLPYPLNAQAWPPRDQRTAFQSRVSGQLLQPLDNPFKYRWLSPTATMLRISTRPWTCTMTYKSRAS